VPALYRAIPIAETALLPVASTLHPINNRVMLLLSLLLLLLNRTMPALEAATLPQLPVAITLHQSTTSFTELLVKLVVLLHWLYDAIPVLDTEAEFPVTVAIKLHL
jgi:hypothetical protein